MSSHELIMLIVLLIPGLALSIIIMGTFAAGGWILVGARFSRPNSISFGVVIDRHLK